MTIRSPLSCNLVIQIRMGILDAKKSKPLKGGPSFSIQHRLYRALWNAVWILFAAWTPAPFHRWRTFLLRCFGAKIDASAHVYGSSRVWYPRNLVMEASSCLGPKVNCYCMAKITILKGAVVSQGSHLCAGMHDIQDSEFQLVARQISIGASAWIAAECFVGPGVTIGNGAVLGARTVLFKNAEDYGVYVGNPAVLIKQRLIKVRV